MVFRFSEGPTILELGVDGISSAQVSVRVCVCVCVCVWYVVCVKNVACYCYCLTKEKHLKQLACLFNSI